MFDLFLSDCVVNFVIRLALTDYSTDESFRLKRAYMTLAILNFKSEQIKYRSESPCFTCNRAAEMVRTRQRARYPIASL